MIGNAAPKSRTIGIDLGTTYLSVGVWENGTVNIIAKDIPSYVAFTENGLLFGLAAKIQADLNPTNTIFDVKRLIGRRFSDHSVQMDMELWPFKVVAGADDRPVIVVGDNGEEKRFLAEEILSMFFKRMKEIAEAHLHTTICNAVVTVPGYFSDSQRRATKDAGAIAGLHVLRLINDSSAAALAYGFQSSEKKGESLGWKNVLIFDLGGGTCDVTLLTAGSGLFEVKGTAGDTHLGGEDFDGRMMNFFLEKFNTTYGKDARGDHKAISRLREVCEKAKRVLSDQEQGPILLNSFFQKIDYVTIINRGDFEEINMDLFGRCMELVKVCLQDAEMDVRCVHQVLMVGGCSGIPRVRQLLKDLFEGTAICDSICPENAVAYGAAIKAANLDRRGTSCLKGLEMLETTSLSLGLDAPGGLMDVLIPRNSFFPTAKERVITTDSDDQASLSIRVYEGEMPATRDNNLLGEFEVLGISPAPRGVPEITVCFSVDADGILEVSAEEDDSTGKKKKQKKNNREVAEHRSTLSHAEIAEIAHKFDAKV